MHAMLGTFSRFDTPYFLLHCRCRHPEGVTEIENKKWLERDSEAYKQLRLVSNYDWLCSISGLSSSTLRGLALGSNHFSPPVTNLYVLLVSGLLINVIVCR